MHDDYRTRYGRAKREYDSDSPRRQIRPRAIAPIARPRRSLASPGLRLSIGARSTAINQASRGAGEVLGDKQSGEMHEIGFQLYSEMLKDAVEALKDGREPDLAMPLAASAEINLHAPALLPADYCGDVQQRLTLYKRLANCRRDAQIDTVQEALIDRFGPL